MTVVDSLIGTVIDGRYRLREFIGKGSFGSVYAADELTLGRVISQVAVKVIAPENNDDRRSVLLEILGLAQLHHDFIINYRSSGEIREGPLAGSIFLATELGDATLSRFLKSGERLTEDEFRELIRGVSLALAHIHASGAIHGDVKPANIVRVKGRWKLGDLGLVRSVNRLATGTVHGSLSYMAPEVLRHEFSPANDIYSLGVTILHYYSGRYAHEGDSREEFAENLRTKPATIPEFLREPWRSLVTKCLQRNPSDRLSAEEIEATVGPFSPHFTPPQERETLVVAPGERGHFANLQDAIAAALPGARILVHPGKYRESLRIDKSLEIIGDGPPESVVVTTRDGHCMEFATEDPVLVRGLTLRVRTGAKGIECYAVDIGMGRPVFKDCQIHSQNLACVAIHDGADPILRRCSIFGSRDAGVFVYDGGRGTFEACDIFSHVGSGVTISDGSDVTFRRCKIYDNQMGGAAIFSGGRATFDECQMLCNAKAGLTIAGTAVLRGCRIADNMAEGLSLKDGAIVRVNGCDLRHNTGGAWRLPTRYQLDQSDNQE
jgi:hypothetical protein